MIRSVELLGFTSSTDLRGRSRNHCIDQDEEAFREGSFDRTLSKCVSIGIQYFFFGRGDKTVDVYRAVRIYITFLFVDLSL
jgi:hypothetical protein